MTGADSLTGATGIVTGGAGSIGRAVAAALEALGAQVACLDRREGTATLSISCDVTDEAEIASAAAEVERRLGAVDFAVCAAGVVSEAPVSELTVAEWRRVVDSSLLGTFLTARAVVPSMTARRRGRIVALSSGHAARGYRHGAHYAAAKAGVEAFVRSLALEVAPAGITVNAVAPGPVDTPMLDHAGDGSRRRRELERVIPLGRVGHVDDVVGPIVFLLGPQAAYMTGQVLHVNGGMLMP